MSDETEVRFAVGRIAPPTVMAGLGACAAESSTYETLYFDTDSLDLNRHQVQLRLRRKNGQIIQTIKAPAQNGNFFGRQEHEILLGALQPNLDHARALLPSELRNALSLSVLKPRFRTRYSRVARLLGDGFDAADASLDVGFIEAAGTRELISEVEFELKGGVVDSYSKECITFLDKVPASILLESKAARGYRLASGELPQPVVAQKISVPPHDPLPHAILSIMRHSLAHLLNNHPSVTLNGKPESIHQMRVGMRRLLSAFRIFRPVLHLEDMQDLLASVRRLFGNLGAVRDADVFLGETLPSVAKAGLGERLEAVVREEISAFRDRGYRAACEELTSPAFAQLVVRLNSWIEAGRWLKVDEPIHALLAERSAEDFATPRIAALLSTLLKRGRQARQGSLSDWHRARIAAKRLRYAEPLFDALAPNAGKLSKRLNRLQTSLGHLNDLETTALLLARVQPQMRSRNRRSFETAWQFCRGWSAATARACIEHADMAMSCIEMIQRSDA